MMEMQVYGIGHLFTFIYDHFIAVRVVSFLIGCIFLRFGITFPLFLFLFSEIVIYWCQFKGPLIDKKRNEEYNQWVHQSMTQDSSESANLLNVTLDQCWKLMLPDCSMESTMCRVITNLLSSILPFFFTDIKITHFTFGQKPPKILQVVTEPQKSVSVLSIQGATVLANDMAIEGTFKFFKIPVTLKLCDIVVYAPIRYMVESPLKNQFMNMAPISAIVFTSLAQPRILSLTTILNGFHVEKLPFVNFIWIYFLEYVFSLVVCNDQYAVWDWVIGNWSIRHLTRTCSEESEKIFKEIATKLPSTSFSRFSLSDSVIARFDETRKLLWERASATKLKPNECLISMGPPHGVDTIPVFEYKEKPQPKTDASVQTDNI